MKAIVVTDEAAGTAGMTLVERPEPPAAINDVIVEIHASGFVPTEMAWPSTWTDRRDRDRTPSIPGHELAGVVAALGYGTTGVSVGQRVFGLADWHRDGTLAEYVAIEARNLAPLPGDVDFTVGASLPISGLTGWQGLFDHGHLRAGQSVLAHGAAGAVGSMVTQLAREAGAYVIGTELTCELRHHRTDCAGGAVHEDALPCLNAAVLEQSLPRGEAGDWQARAHREVDVARQRREVACLDGYILRQGAVAMPVGEAEHPLSYRQSRCAVAESSDHSGQLVAGD